MIRFVKIKLVVEGLHQWIDCPIIEVNYLKHQHRHNFHITCIKEVAHNERDIEIIRFKHDIERYLKTMYFSKNYNCLDFGNMSCETIAEELLLKHNLTSCEVLEDNENGAIIKQSI